MKNIKKLTLLVIMLLLTLTCLYFVIIKFKSNDYTTINNSDITNNTEIIEDIKIQENNNTKKKQGSGSQNINDSLFLEKINIDFNLLNDEDE